MANETFTATQTTVLTTDNDADGVIDPGDVVTTTVTITNNSTNTDATGVQFTETLNGMTLLNQPGNDINVSPLAVNDSYTAIGNTLLEVGNATNQTGPQSSVAGHVTDNDVEFFGDTFEITAVNGTSPVGGTVTVTTSNGGTVTMDTSAADRGSFTYISNDGFTGTDTFTYTITDDGLDGIAGTADDLSTTATVTINVTGQVWYVNSAAGPGGDGTSTNPFNSITAANLNGAGGAGDVDDAGDYIYVQGSPAGPLTLEANQHLIGTGSALVVNGVTLAAAGTNSTLSASSGTTLTLGTGNEVAGITITNSAAAGAGISGNTFGTATINNVAVDTTGQALNLTTGTVAGTGFTSVDSDGGTNNVSLTGVLGTVNLGTGALSGATGTAFNISGGTASIDYNGSIAKTSDGRAIDVQNHTGGTVSFDSTVSSTNLSDGVNLQNNTGATINFTNTLTLNTSASGTTAFNATGGGTVTATGTGSTINSGAGTALNVANTNIGAADLTFQSVSASGAAKGISLNTTGSSGGLHITGVGTTDGSGGTIQNISTRGIELISTADVSIKNVALTNANTVDGTSLDLDISNANAAIYMSNVATAVLDNVDINGTVQNGINGINVSNFTLNNSTITQAGNGANESGIEFSNLSGTSSITNSNISFSETNSVDIVNTDANLNLTVTGSTFRDTQTVSSGGAVNGNGEGGIQFRSFSNAAGTPTTNINIDNNDFLRLRTQAIQVVGEDDSIVNVNITDNTIDSGADIGTGVDINGNDDAQVNFNVIGNTIHSRGGSAVNITSFLDADVMGRVNDNTDITVADIGEGVRVVAQETSSTIVEIKHNTVTIAPGSNSSAITGQARFQSARLDITIDNNTTTVNATAVDDIDIIGGSSASGETSQVFANILNNHVSNAATNMLRLRVSDLDATSDPRIFLTGFVEGGAGIDDDAVATWNANGNTPTATSANINVSLTGTAVAPSAGTALVPTNPLPPPLLAAPGGVEPEDANPLVETTTQPDPDAQQPAIGATPPPSNPGMVEAYLTQADLDAAVAAATARWEATGLTAEQTAALHQMTFTVADLSGLYLGLANPGHVAIDSDGAGYGWYVDATPGDNVEFANGGGTRLTANSGAAPAGHMDLLTTVMHEMGHQLGLGDSYATADRDSLMYGYLVTGERRLPSEGGADGAVIGSIDSEEFLGAPVDIGTLPFGKTVTIQWQATINAQNNQLIVNPQNTGTVSATNAVGFADQNTNTVTTTLDSLTLGNLVFNDLDHDGVFGAGETGINGVALTLFADTNGNNAFDPGTDAQIATAITAGGGLYSFTGLAPGNYILRVDQGNFGIGQVLENGLSSPGNPDPDDGDPDTDNDDNGAPLAGQGVVTQAITLAYNTEPTAGTGNDTNNTLDIGVFFNQVPALDLDANNSTAAGTAFATTFTENAGAVTIADTDTSITDGDHPNMVSATITLANAQAGDSLTVSNPAALAALGISIDGASTATSILLTGTASRANYESAIELIVFNNSGDNPGTLVRDVTVVVNDSLSDSNTAHSLITVNAVNDAPLLSAGATPVLNALNEDAGAPGVGAGTLVSSLVDLIGGGGLDNVTDLDNANIGIALTNVDGTNGAWFYSLDNGNNWNPVGAVTNASALLLAADASTRLYFQPNANFNGTVNDAITFRAWDRSTGNNGASAVDTTINGDPTAFSTATDTANITVNAVNDAPALANVGVLVATNEQTAVLLDTNAVVSDIDLDGNVAGGDYAGASLAIARQGGANADDTFGFSTAGANFTVSGSTLRSGGLTFANFSIVAGILAIDFTSSATIANTALVNDVLDHITYTNQSDTPPASVTLAYTFNDGSPGHGQGAGAAATATGSTQVNLTAVNDAPVNNMPGTVQAVPDAFIAGLSVSDADAAAGILTTVLSVGNGTLTIAAVGGAGVSGSGTATVTLTGTLAQINATLAAADNVAYHGNAMGNDTLTMQTSDGGNSGIGGTLTDTDSIAIQGGHTLPLHTHGSGNFDIDPSSGYMLRRADGTFLIQDVDNNQVSAHVLGPVGNEWEHVGSADFNGNGVSDMLLERTTDHMLSLYNIDNNQVVSNSLLGPIGGDWHILALGDFNGDGTDDALTQREGDHRLNIYTFQNSQITAATTVGQIGGEWHFLDAGDFNNDGTGDLLWQRDSDHMLLIAQIHNTGIGPASFLGQLGSEWHFAGMGDFNGDDTQDLLWQRNDGTLQIFNINNSQIASSTIVETLPPDANVAGIRDYTGDGVDDVLLQFNDGRFDMQEIHNNTITQIHHLGQVGAEWHVV